MQTTELIGKNKSVLNSVPRDITLVVIEDNAFVAMSSQYDPKRWCVTVQNGIITNIAVG